MSAPVSAPTLRDDWQERRAFLAHAGRGNEFVDVQLRVLDFLLKRYGDSPEAAQPAQFPLPSAIYINQRAVLVHHHLGKHLASGVKSPQEAQQRMASILHRMTEPHSAEVSLDQELTSGASSPADEVKVEGSIVAPFVGESREVRDARRLRFLLADPDPAVRVRTIWQLGEEGDLDDVGLLMDLLALPESPDEEPRERQMLVQAIEKISGTRPRGEELEPRPHGPLFNAVVERQRAAAASDWTRLHGLLLSSSFAMGLAMVVTVIAILFTSGTSTSAIFTATALVAVYGLGVMTALYLWERTRRRRRW
jgi:hypothetical protein